MECTDSLCWASLASGSERSFTWCQDCSVCPAISLLASHGECWCPFPSGHYSVWSNSLIMFVPGSVSVCALFTGTHSGQPCLYFCSLGDCEPQGMTPCTVWWHYSRTSCALTSLCLEVPTDLIVSSDVLFLHAWVSVGHEENIWFRSAGGRFGALLPHPD